MGPLMVVYYATKVWNWFFYRLGQMSLCTVHLHQAKKLKATGEILRTQLQAVSCVLSFRGGGTCCFIYIHDETFSLENEFFKFLHQCKKDSRSVGATLTGALGGPNVQKQIKRLVYILLKVEIQWRIFYCSISSIRRNQHKK